MAALPGNHYGTSDTSFRSIYPDGGNYCHHPEPEVVEFVKQRKYGQALPLIQKVPGVLGCLLTKVSCKEVLPILQGRTNGWTGRNFRRLV